MTEIINTADFPVKPICGKSKTLSGKILVSQFDPLEKRRHQLTEDVEIEIENKFNRNLRERNPQTAIVHVIFDGCNDIKINDRVLLHHFTFNDGSGDKVEPQIVHDGVELYAVNYDECYFVLAENGEIDHPIGNYILCVAEEDRVEEKTQSGIIIPQTAVSHKKKRDERHLTVLHSGNSEYVKNGDKIISTYHYEITINKNKFIRVREENILGILI